MPTDANHLAPLNWFVVFLGAGLGGLCRWLLALGINGLLQRTHAGSPIGFRLWQFFFRQYRR